MGFPVDVRRDGGGGADAVSAVVVSGCAALCGMTKDAYARPSATGAGARGCQVSNVVTLVTALTEHGIGAGQGSGLFGVRLRHSSVPGLRQLAVSRD